MRYGKAMVGVLSLAAWSVVAAVAVAGQNAATPAGAGGGAPRVLVPHETWTCGMPGGIPGPETGTLLFTAVMPLDRLADIGRTQYGRRQVAVSQEGTLSGAKLSGTVMTGGLDFELTLSNGVVEVEQIFVFRMADGKYVYARAAGTGADARDVRIVMDFEAPNASDVAWLNSGAYVARRVIDAEAKTLTLRVYELSAPAATAGAGNAIRISKPAGAPAQPWDYRRADPTEKQGPQLITERVTLSPSQSVGASKRGNRNIIPITGGELSGRINGIVLPGGADYQNLGKPATIDARYLWQTKDGEIIIVRNGGAFGSLVPTFEVRTDSPYAWLNDGLYLSSNPGMASGGVSLTFYESAR
jgi:hypothetical protein